jgi:hypothetical protein
MIGAMLIGTACTTASAAPAKPDWSRYATMHESGVQVKHRPRHQRHWDRRRAHKPAATVSDSLAPSEIRVAPLSNSQTRAIRNHRECSWRHFSYDRSSGTFMGRDGFRHFCP